MIKRLYWPYDWRPGQVWYRIKCFLWHRYTTVKPRYLGHTWHDRCTVMPHMVFEVLSQFIERECSPGYVDWYGEYGHKIDDLKNIHSSKINKRKYVRDEMQELYTWWHQVYNKLYPAICERLWRKVSKHNPVVSWVGDDILEYKPEWATLKDEKRYKLCLDAINNLENRMGQELKENLHRIVEIIPYLWT